MDKFSDKVNKNITKNKYKEVSFESILGEIINNNISLDIDEVSGTYAIGGIDTLVSKLMTILKVSGANIDLDIVEKVELYNTINKYNTKAKDLIRLYETYSPDGFINIVDNKVSKINNIQILEGIYQHLDLEPNTDKVLLYKKSIQRRIGELKK